MQGAQSVTVMVMSGTGSRYESAKENGMAHFLEHMVFKGSKNRPTAKVIAEEIDSVGGVFNAFTAKDHTAYYAKVDARHFQTAFDVVTDIFRNPLFPKGEIERERGTIIEEIHMYEDMPMHAIFQVFDRTIHGKHTQLGRPILGSKKNIKAFTKADFKRYFARNYIAENSAICVAGSFSKTTVLAEAKKAFADMRTGALPQHAPYTHKQATPRLGIAYKKTDQTHLILGVPSCAIGHQDEMVAEVLAHLLGGGMSSRLFIQVRERRGLAYYIKAEQDAYDDTGLLYMRAGVSNRATKEAIEVILTEVRKLTKTLVKDTELAKVKEYTKGRLSLSLDTTDAQAAYIGYNALVRKSSEGIETFNAAIDAVTAEDVRRLAKRIFTTQNLNLALIGPHTNEAALSKLLKI